LAQVATASSDPNGLIQSSAAVMVKVLPHDETPTLEMLQSAGHRFRQNGMQNLQENISPTTRMRKLFRPMRSFLQLDTLIEELEIVEFAITKIEKIFDQPFFEEERSQEMEQVWECVAKFFDTRGTPPCLFKLSCHLDADVRSIVLAKWFAYHERLEADIKSDEFTNEQRENVQVLWNGVCMALLDESKLWGWAYQFEQLLKTTENYSCLNEQLLCASDVVLDPLHKDKSGIFFSLMRYRTSMKKQIHVGTTMQSKVLALFVSLCIAASQFLANYLSREFDV